MIAKRTIIIKVIMILIIMIMIDNNKDKYDNNIDNNERK